MVLQRPSVENLGSFKTEKGHRNRHRVQRTIAWVALAMIFALPPCGLVVGSWLTSASDDVITPPKAVTAQAVHTTFNDEREVELALTWADGAQIHAPQWQGVVTSVDIESSQVLETGTKVASVDGISRIAAASPAPLYSVTSPDSPRAQVKQLNMLLASLGYRHGGGDTWNWETGAGVQDFTKKIGANSGGELFDPAWIVWLPQESMQLSEVKLLAGTPAPAGGTPIASTPPVLSKVLVNAVDEGALPDAAQAAWVLRFKELTVPFEGVELNDNRSRASLRSAMNADRPESVAATVSRSEPVAGWEVASSAIFLDKRGTQCVFVERRGGHDAVHVSVLGGSPGVARVIGNLKPRPAILVNPAQIYPDSSCD